MSLLSVENIYVGYTFDIVRNVNFVLNKGEILAIVGESGSGKSTLLKALLGKHPGSGNVRKGHIYYRDRDIVGMGKRELMQIRGKALSMIFQSPGATLNPVRKIGGQFTELLCYHTDISKKEAYNTAMAVLKTVNLRDPDSIMKSYAFQLSGGMKQRVSIAMALALRPEILLADEPTSALDATVQKSVVEELLKLHRSMGTAMIIVTHNMMLANYMADRIAVMYAGELVEIGERSSLMQSPAHPYTKALINSIPRIDAHTKIQGIGGKRISLSEVPAGCLFANRCPYKTEECLTEHPGMRKLGQKHYAACHYQ